MFFLVSTRAKICYHSNAHRFLRQTFFYLWPNRNNGKWPNGFMKIDNAETSTQYRSGLHFDNAHRTWYPRRYYKYTVLYLVPMILDHFKWSQCILCVVRSKVVIRLRMKFRWTRASCDDQEIINLIIVLIKVHSKVKICTVWIISLLDRENPINVIDRCTCSTQNFDVNYIAHLAHMFKASNTYMHVFPDWQ